MGKWFCGGLLRSHGKPQSVPLLWFQKVFLVKIFLFFLDLEANRWPVESIDEGRPTGQRPTRVPAAGVDSERRCGVMYQAAPETCVFICPFFLYWPRFNCKYSPRIKEGGLKSNHKIPNPSQIFSLDVSHIDDGRTQSLIAARKDRSFSSVIISWLNLDEPLVTHEVQEKQADGRGHKLKHAGLWPAGTRDDFISKPVEPTEPGTATC